LRAHRSAYGTGPQGQGIVDAVPDDQGPVSVPDLLKHDLHLLDWQRLGAEVGDVYTRSDSPGLGDTVARQQQLALKPKGAKFGNGRFGLGARLVRQQKPTEEFLFNRDACNRSLVVRWRRGDNSQLAE